MGGTDVLGDRPASRTSAKAGGIIMMHLELTTEEQLLLAQVLERRILDLEIEVLHTDRAEFKLRLKERLNELRRLQEHFSAQRMAMAA